MSSNRKPIDPPTSTELIELSDLDIVRVEKNLFYIGFFGATSYTKKAEARRQVKLVVSRDGKAVELTAEFVTPDIYGLPTTADQDKFIAFSKIASEQRNSFGRIENPIVFPGARMLRELGMSDSGENYDSINIWAKRLQATQINGDFLIYWAASKKYANSSMGVFRSFKRTGETNGNIRSENYEIVVEDWVLENLNSNYVLLEDFLTYKRLNRPTGKALFHHLLSWFRSNNGHPIVKDYSRLCSLLDLKMKSTPSQIRQALTPAMRELMAVGYLSRWDVQERASGVGYNILLAPGSAILSFLRIAARQFPLGSSTHLALPSDTDVARLEDFPITNEQQQAIDAMLAIGVGPKSTARDYANIYDPNDLIDLSEYVREAHIRGKSHTPGGLFVHLLHKNFTVPDDFVSTRKAAAAEAEKHQRHAEEQLRRQQEMDFLKWKNDQIDSALLHEFPGATLQNKLKALRNESRKNHEIISQTPPEFQDKVALQILRKEIEADLALPTCEDWCKTHAQFDLFN